MTIEQKVQAAKLWLAGVDTLGIAKLLHIQESEIYNRIIVIRELARMGKHFEDSTT